MRHILKPFEEWGTRLRTNEFERAAWRLTLFYITSTFCILLLSSGAILLVYTPPDKVVLIGNEETVEIEHGEFGWYELQENLPQVMLMIDISILILVSGLSYVAARRTLRPIQANQERQFAFLGTVAHELRTPLAVIQAGGETMFRQVRSVSEYQAYVSDVYTESKRLTRLTDQLLQLLRGVKIEEQLSPSNLSTLLSMELNRLDAYAQMKDVVITREIAANVFVLAAPDRLVQVIQNLVKNAIDYNHQLGQVTVTLQINHKVVTLTVSDTGIGIKEADLSIIFDRFETLDRARTHHTHTGAGLGLAIVKDIITSLSGTITFASTVGVGTTVTVTLPLLHS